MLHEAACIWIYLDCPSFDSPGCLLSGWVRGLESHAIARFWVTLYKPPQDQHFTASYTALCVQKFRHQWALLSGCAYLPVKDMCLRYSKLVRYSRPQINILIMIVV